MLEPTDAHLDPAARALTLTWSDGQRHRLDFTRLRKACPCATCRTEREKVRQSMGLRVLNGPGTPSLAPVLTAVEPIGRYALRLVWDDGHSAGLFTYASLRELGEPPPSTP